jgi:hypothetical protein
MPRDREYLLDILESARLACDYLRGKTEQEFLDDVQQVGRVSVAKPDVQVALGLQTGDGVLRLQKRP